MHEINLQCRKNTSKLQDLCRTPKFCLHYRTGRNPHHWRAPQEIIGTPRKILRDDVWRCQHHSLLCIYRSSDSCLSVQTMAQRLADLKLMKLHVSQNDNTLQFSIEKLKFRNLKNSLLKTEIVVTVLLSNSKQM